MKLRDEVEAEISAVYYNREDGADDFQAEAEAACKVIAKRLRTDGVDAVLAELEGPKRT